MSFVSRFNPKTGVADFWQEFRKPNPYRGPMLLLSILPIAIIIYWAASEEVYRNPERPNITYITSFAPDRTDAEIIASNEENQEINDLREAERERIATQKREMYKALGAASGFDVEQMEADAEAERAAEEAAAKAAAEAAKAKRMTSRANANPQAEDTAP